MNVKKIKKRMGRKRKGEENMKRGKYETGRQGKLEEK